MRDKVPTVKPDFKPDFNPISTGREDFWTECYESYACKKKLEKEGKWQEGKMVTPWRDNCIQAECKEAGKEYKGHWNDWTWDGCGDWEWKEYKGHWNDWTWDGC